MGLCLQVRPGFLTPSLIWCDCGFCSSWKGEPVSLFSVSRAIFASELMDSFLDLILFSTFRTFPFRITFVLTARLKDTFVFKSQGGPGALLGWTCNLPRKPSRQRVWISSSRGGGGPEARPRSAGTCRLGPGLRGRRPQAGSPEPPDLTGYLRL